MPAHSFLRGRSAFIAFVALWVCTGAVKGQEILKELEQTDSDATKVPSGHNHEHGAVSGSKKAPKEDKGHGGHRHAMTKENKKDGGHRHTASGGKGGKQTGSHDTSHTGAGTHGDQHQMHGFLGPYPIQREGSGTRPTQRHTSVFTLPTATGKLCTTRCSTSCTTIRVDRAEATRPS